MCCRGSRTEGFFVQFSSDAGILTCALGSGIMFWSQLSESLLWFCFLKVFNKMAGFAYLLIEFFCLGNMQILNPAAHFNKEIAII